MLSCSVKDGVSWLIQVTHSQTTKILYQIKQITWATLDSSSLLYTKMKLFVVEICQQYCQGCAIYRFNDTPKICGTDWLSLLLSSYPIVVPMPFITQIAPFRKFMWSTNYDYLIADDFMYEIAITNWRHDAIINVDL